MDGVVSSRRITPKCFCRHTDIILGIFKHFESVEAILGTAVLIES